jgi:hypothetical protein
MTEPRILTQEWRENHVRLGDGCLETAMNLHLERDRDQIVALAQLAQAHYQAANVRAKLLI